MKKTKIISLTATALILSLCGIFFQAFSPSPTSVSAMAVSKTESAPFSLEKAQRLEYFCLFAAYPNVLEALLTESGYENMNYAENPQTGAIGSGIALGIARRENEILVAVRASEGAEWYSNFHIGTGETHAGFLSAALFAQNVLEDYISSQGLSKKDINITLTGHSRGGAVANLMAKELIDSASFSQVTAYTFASPNTTRDFEANNQRYNSIYNIQNPEDFVCFIPLESWGYTKYGRIINLPEKSEKPEAYDAMEQKFKALTGYPHIGYERGHKEIEEFTNHASSLAPTVEEAYGRVINTPMGDLTLYGYLEKIASLLSGENPVSGGFFILSSLQSKDLAPMTDFLIKGMCFDTPEDSFDLTKSTINSGHAFETYLSWLLVLDESYFLDKITS